MIFRSFAATGSLSKVWDTDADFNSSSTKSSTVVANNSVTLQGSSGGGNPANIDVRATMDNTLASNVQPYPFSFGQNSFGNTGQAPPGTMGYVSGVGQIGSAAVKLTLPPNSTGTLHQNYIGTYDPPLTDPTKLNDGRPGSAYWYGMAVYTPADTLSALPGKVITGEWHQNGTWCNPNAPGPRYPQASLHFRMDSSGSLEYAPNTGQQYGDPCNPPAADGKTFGSYGEEWEIWGWKWQGFNEPQPPAGQTIEQAFKGKKNCYDLVNYKCPGVTVNSVFKPDKWTYIIYAIKWTRNWDGELYLWARNTGDTAWRPVFQLRKFPTAIYQSGTYPHDYPGGDLSPLSAWIPAILYLGNHSTSLSMYWDQIVRSHAPVPYDPANSRYASEADQGFKDIASELGFSGTGSGTTYPTTGSITLTHDAGQAVNWASAVASETKPAGTNITYQYKTSSDNANWSAPTADIATLADGRYLQVIATLTTSNTSATPSLDKLTITYDPVSSTPPPPVSPPGGYIFGTYTQGAIQAAFSADYKWTNRYSLTNASDINKLVIYVDGNGPAVSGSATLKGVIYAADSSNNPVALLGVSNVLTVNKGDAGAWKDLTFASPVHLNQGTYYIGVIVGGTPMVARDAIDIPTGGGTMRNGDDIYSDGPSDPFGTPTVADAVLSLYAVGGASTVTPPAFVSSNITAGQTVTTPFDWTATVSGSVASVEFWANNQKLGTDTTAPYSFNIGTSTLTAGANTLGLAIVGTDGTRLTPQIGQVTVNNTASKPGDLNNDNQVNIQDLSILLSNYGKTGSGDLNNDGTVNIVDLSVLMSNYGK